MKVNPLQMRHKTYKRGWGPGAVVKKSDQVPLFRIHTVSRVETVHSIPFSNYGEFLKVSSLECFCLLLLGRRRTSPWRVCSFDTLWFVVSNILLAKSSIEVKEINRIFSKSSTKKSASPPYSRMLHSQYILDFYFYRLRVSLHLTMDQEE